MLEASGLPSAQESGGSWEWGRVGWGRKGLGRAGGKFPKGHSPFPKSTLGGAPWGFLPPASIPASNGGITN